MRAMTSGKEFRVLKETQQNLSLFSVKQTSLLIHHSVVFHFYASPCTGTMNKWVLAYICKIR
jgi:hypothetical protein